MSLIFMALVLGAALMTTSYVTYKNSMNRQYENMGNQIARTVMTVLDDELIGTYSRQVDNADPEEIMAGEEYQDLIRLLRELKEDNEVLYLYMVRPTETGAYFIFDTDETEGACPYGYFMEYYEGSFSKHVDELLAGDFLPPIISKEGYGWIISITYPYFSDDELLGYLCIDLSMDDVISQRMRFMRQLIAITFLIVVVICFLDYLFFNRVLVRPVKKMSEATEGYIHSKEQSGTDGSLIDRLDIRTGDELQDLCTSLKKMEKDLNEYMKELTTVTSEKERIGAELDVATRIQSNMLPGIFPPFPDRKEFDIFATMNPAKEVGGDFYDFFLLDHDHLGLVMADVSGKGVPAALFMVIAKTLIKNRAQMGGTPDEILAYVNEQLTEGNDAGYFVTVWLAIIEISTGKGLAVNAGHEHPVVKHADGIFELSKRRHSPAVGIMEGMKFGFYEFQLHPGDRLFVYTDGIPEATDAALNMFGNDRMIESLNRRRDLPAKELLHGVKADIDAFVGNAPQFDDVTMLCMDYYGVSEEVVPEADTGDDKEAHTAASAPEERMQAKLVLDATVENLDLLNEFLEEQLTKLGCSMKEIMQLQLSAEEVFVNIASYAYTPARGKAWIDLETLPEDRSVVEISFRDNGKPYDPLKKEDPDITLPAEERGIGGLGIFMVKSSMDDVQYEYQDFQNVLRIRKRVQI